MRQNQQIGDLWEWADVAPHGAGDGTADHVIFAPQDKVRVKEVIVLPAAGWNGDNTNTFHLNVKKWIAGLATEVANRDYATGVNETALVKRSLYAPATPLNLDPGDGLTLEREKIGTGLATPHLRVGIRFDYAR